jgi:L-lactate dehydrogenase complex protein LldG
VTARADILAAIRACLGGATDAPAVAAAAQELALESAASRPRLPDGDLADVFAARLVSTKVVGASVDRIGRLEDAPAAVARYCAAHGLERALALQPDPALQKLDWSGFAARTAIGPNETLAVARARWGIAETGSFVFHSGPHSPTLLSFLPLHHVCIIERARILAYLEDYAAAERDSPAPRNVNLITGASGTSDIEGRLVRGAHGPEFLHALIVDEPAGAP